MSRRVVLVGVSDIARRANVRASAVSNWRARYRDFPRPVATVGNSPAFAWWQVERFMTRHNLPGIARDPSKVGDTVTVDAIAAVLSGNEWSPNDLETIADLVRATGREIADVDDVRGEVNYS